ncbi:uncharacterized protein Pyn_05043 [Prunus yedoensis var. nudiflora]|uniref:Uncharacterized protein n=1 Tax=Prunus yedoensis var. nudiflora TaxID=2094558 RepID=A0A314Z477_PRUYE|nr:uncharacterized protein Pyn_05043 [Prunus yedoensis var. nudiflora]
MQYAKEKLSNMASSAKEHVNIYKAKVEEKLEAVAARTKEEKKMAKERRKVKEARAKMELHKAKARRAEKKLSSKQPHVHGGGRHHHHQRLSAGTRHMHGHQHLGTAEYPMAGTH